MGYTKPHAHVRSVSFNAILYANIIIPYLLQTQSSKWWFYKGFFFFKVTQYQLNIRYRTLRFSTIQFFLQPPLQYLPLISFLSSLAIFHLIISPSEVFPNPFLQSLPTLLSTLIEKCNSLLFHTEISTVPTKNFPLSQQFSQFNLKKPHSEQ